ncbi:MAG TPA: hypothetical protein VGR07_01395 [Thermoanaerobaculia bacterium]|jgi:hypothetical protein|nr:hypothetical protein [Thermoanaerobaculia bacterium]
MLNMRGRGRGTGSGTKQVTWIVCLVLYLVALAVNFRVIHIANASQIGTWAWILGFGLLLVADKVRGL